MEQFSYARLGGGENITQIASDLIDLHIVNPWIASRYTDSDLDVVKKQGIKFFRRYGWPRQLFEQGYDSGTSWDEYR